MNMFKIAKKPNLFTLIELIAVVVVLSILVAIVIPNINNSKKEAIISMMDGNIRNIQTVVDMYQLKNEGSLPTSIQPTLENPQKVEFSLLYPTYIKSLPNEKKLPTQRYWVDVYGKVWGSTVDSPNSFFQSSQNIEWENDKKAVGYNFYEINSKKAISKVQNMIISLKKKIIPQGEDRIQIPNLNNPFLVSSVDEYGFETAPVGPNYQGIAEDWFSPIFRKDGTFLIEFGGLDIMYWDRFWTLEDKPEGTNIQYFFSVQKDDGTWTEYVDDFYALESSKRIRIQVKMIGNENVKPSLLDMRIDFHFNGEQLNRLNLVPNQQVPFDIPNGYSIYSYNVPSDHYVQNISSPYTSNYSQGTSYPIMIYNSIGNPIHTINQIERGSTIYIASPSSSPYNTPLVEVAKTPVSLKQVNPVSKDILAFDYLMDLPKIKDSQWTTVDGFNLFFFGGSSEEVDWLNANIEDKKPEHTRILYYYSPNDGDGWSTPLEDISQVPNSRAMKVAVVMQIETSYIGKVQYPEFISMTLDHAGGTLQPTPKGEDFIVIYPNKLNDFDKNGYHPSTKIEWDYLFESASGFKANDVEWRGDKENQYPNAGTFSLGLRVKNEKGVWSHWVDTSISIIDGSRVEDPSWLMLNKSMSITTSLVTASSPTTTAITDGSNQTGHLLEYSGNGKNALTYELPTVMNISKYRLYGDYPAGWYGISFFDAYGKHLKTLDQDSGSPTLNWSGSESNLVLNNVKYIQVINWNTNNQYKIYELNIYGESKPKEKPIAKISMISNNVINQKIISIQNQIEWKYNQSYDNDGDKIVDVEWKGIQSSYTTLGEYTVQLRVKASDGEWSDWVNHTFTVVENLKSTLSSSVSKSLYTGYQGYGKGIILEDGNLVKRLRGNGNTPTGEFQQYNFKPNTTLNSQKYALYLEDIKFTGNGGMHIYTSPYYSSPEFVNIALYKDRVYNEFGSVSVNGGYDLLLISDFTNNKSVALVDTSNGILEIRGDNTRTTDWTHQLSILMAMDSPYREETKFEVSKYVEIFDNVIISKYYK